jgi:hypothetical protein
MASDTVSAGEGLADPERFRQRVLLAHDGRFGNVWEEVEWADKPGSVVCDHLSRDDIAVVLMQATRMRVGPTHGIPIRPCSGWGLPSRPVAGTLVRSYRTVSAFPRGHWGHGEFSFLWHFPSGRPAQPLAGILPYGARTFLSMQSMPQPHGPLREAL